MKNELRYYKIAPLVYKANKKSAVKIKALDGNFTFYDDREYLIKIIALEETPDSYNDESATCYHVTPQNGVIEFKHAFSNEQEHFVRVYMYTDNPQWVCQLSVYSVFEDLFNKNPYKADMHIHTNKSDGRETPETVVANYRKAGFDYIAITDHYSWYPSQQAIDFYKDLSVDIKLFNGEEVQPPDNKIHMVNFGGTFSVNEIYQKNEQAYLDEVSKIELKITVPEGVNKREYASCLWVAEKIKQAGGLSIFCHPMWLVNGYHVNRKLTEYILETEIFDAFEVCGGVDLKHNMLQDALFNDARAKGKKVSIVGSSDSHSTVNFWSFDNLKSIVFSESLEKDNIINSIKNGYSVAIDHFKGNEPRFHGSYRLMAYAIFLWENYFPLHDEMCFAEGKLMGDYVSGDKNALQILEKMQGRGEEYLNECYGR